MKKAAGFVLLGGTLLRGSLPSPPECVVVLGEGQTVEHDRAAPPFQIVSGSLTGANIHNETSRARSRLTSTTPAVRQVVTSPPAAGASLPGHPMFTGCSPPRSPTARQGAAPGTQSVLSSYHIATVGVSPRDYPCISISTKMATSDKTSGSMRATTSRPNSINVA